LIYYEKKILLTDRKNIIYKTNEQVRIRLDASELFLALLSHVRPILLFEASEEDRAAGQGIK